MKLTKVISTITPHDTFFVLKVDRNGDTYCEGVLTFWVVAEVDNEEGDKFIDSFPIPERYDYCTTSRNGLATSGMYPQNKTGNSQLEADLRQLEELQNEFIR